MRRAMMAVLAVGLVFPALLGCRVRRGAGVALDKVTRAAEIAVEAYNQALEVETQLYLQQKSLCAAAAPGCRFGPEGLELWRRDLSAANERFIARLTAIGPEVEQWKIQATARAASLGP